jgi:hypothetical protein
MGIDEAMMGASRKTASAVPGSQRAPHCRRYRAGFAADVERVARGIVGYAQQATLAGDAAGGVWREALTAFEFAAVVFFSGKCFRCNVHHHLVAFGRWCWLGAVA